MAGTSLKDVKLKVMAKLPEAGTSLPMAKLLADYAEDPLATSAARASVLELKEEGLLKLDDAGNLTRAK